jgi:hypothetical protein
MRHPTTPKTVVLSVILFILTLIALSVFGNDIPLNQNFVAAIHQVETAGRLGPIHGDYGELGPLQITPKYWADSRIRGKFTDCSDLQYSVRVMTAYLNRYARDAILKGDTETLARVHNGGLKGATNPATDIYWHRVKKTIDKLPTIK